MKQKSILVFLFVAAGAVIIGFIAQRAYKEYRRNQQIEQEIGAIRAEAERMRKNNQDLKERIAYFEMPEFQEKMAKEKLNFQKNDEEVVIIKSSPSSDALERIAAEPEVKSEMIEEEPNYKKWWNQFFRY